MMTTLMLVGAVCVGPCWSDGEPLALSATPTISAEHHAPPEQATTPEPLDLTLAEAVVVPPPPPTPYEALVRWISETYGAPVDMVEDVVEAARTSEGVEPTLVLAIAAVESGFDPKARNPSGAQGLMQVMTRVHHERFREHGGRKAAFDPVASVRVGVQILREYIDRAGSVRGGLKHYVGAAKHQNDGGYAAKVLAEQRRLMRVMAGGW